MLSAKGLYLKVWINEIESLKKNDRKTNRLKYKQ